MTEQNTDYVRVVTFVHAVSESTDHYYFVFHDNPSDEEIQRRLDSEELMGDDAGCVYLEHVERAQIDGEA